MLALVGVHCRSVALISRCIGGQGGVDACRGEALEAFVVLTVRNPCGLRARLVVGLRVREGRAVRLLQQLAVRQSMCHPLIWKTAALGAHLGAEHLP